MEEFLRGILVKLQSVRDKRVIYFPIQPSQWDKSKLGVQTSRFSNFKDAFNRVHVGAMRHTSVRDL